MSVAKVIEISASSAGFEDAILAGVSAHPPSTTCAARGSRAKVVGEGGRIKVYRVNMSVTFVVGEVDE
jgi:hypothetical protein